MLTLNQQTQIIELLDVERRLEIPLYHRTRELQRFQVGCRSCNHRTTLQACQATQLYIMAHDGHRTWFRHIEKYQEPEIQLEKATA